MAKHSIFKDVMTGLMALRGVQLMAAMTSISEIGDIKRFDSAPQLMAYLGLVPSEYSSGGSRHRGGITKTRNVHVRRVLIEAAWAYRHPARKTRRIEAKQSAPEEVREISWKAQVRLCGRYRSFEAREKNKLQACTAIARELSGFIWAIGQSYPSPIAP
jgi:transposase